ncbi:Hypothetical predicted protein [Cloeon dipterum]|uniref:26S proteasome non-ATPase regulatory subunit 5 n=1 Tax=Cloeon dipterum TaxID=197152 RepID=A0A8S1C4Q8_9INSE|nr:Hypothetical predicted protein [Cloeon dipterum]
MTVKDNEWFREKVENINTYDVFLVSTELKKLDRESRKNLYSHVDFSQFVNGLPAQLALGAGNEYFEAFADLIVMLLEYKNPFETFADLNVVCGNMLEHKHEKVREVGVSLVILTLECGESHCLLSSPDYLSKVVKLASNTDLNAASPALTAISRLICKSPDNCRLFLLGPVGAALKADWESASEVHRVRVYNLATEAACLSEEFLKVVVDSKILFFMQERLQNSNATSDPLSLMNIIECFAKLSKVEWGFNYLARSGTFVRLEDSLVSENLGPMQSIIMPELYELFGNLSQTVPEKILSECPRFVPHILKSVPTASVSPHITRAEIAMIGQVATQVAGKIYLSQQFAELEEFYAYLKNRANSGVQEDKMCVLDTAAALLYLKPDEQSNALCRLMSQWFEAIFTSVRRVHEKCAEPFPETVLPALQLLLVVSQQAWGRREMMATPGLFEWLLDREAACGVHKSTGSGGNPAVLRAKYDIVKVLNNSDDLELSPEQKDSLGEFVKQGPFFKRGMYEVATEAPGN